MTRTTSLTLFIVALLMSLNGCAKQVATHEDAVASIKESPANKALVGETWAAADSAGLVDDGWIRNFKDPQLLSFVDEAETNNFDLKISAAKVEQANALVRQASAALKPAVGLGAGYADSNNSNVNREQYGGGLKISWEADVWGRIRSGVAGTTESAAATRSDYEFARQSLAASTANAWFIAIGSKVLKDYANDIVALLRESLRVVKVKNQVGQVTMRDVHLAQADLAAAEEAARKALAAEENAKRSLELLLGRYPSADLATASTLTALPPPVAAGMPSQMLERRPDLIAAEQRVAAAFYKQKEAELLHLPRFNFSVGLGITNLTDAASNLAAGLIAPLYTGGAIEAEVDQATAVQKQAIAAYAQTALQAFKDVETALAGEDHLLQREEYLQTVAEENYQAYQLTKKQFDIGQIDLLDVLTVQNRWIQARIALIDVSTQRLLNRVGLHLALGGSFAVNE